MQVVLGEKAKETLAKMKEGGHVDVTDVSPSVDAVVSPLTKRTKMTGSSGE